MFFDNVVIAGVVTVGLMVAFFAGLGAPASGSSGLFFGPLLSALLASSTDVIDTVPG